MGPDSSPPASDLGSRLQALPGAVAISNLSRGTTLYGPGDDAGRVFVLTSGRVKISIEGPGGKHCLFHIIEPNEIFGEEALLGEAVRPASAEVIEKAAVTMIAKAEVEKFAASIANFWDLMSPILSQRLQNLRQHLQWVTFLEVEQRIARLVLHWVSGSADPIGQELQLSQRDLAGLVGATRETTSGALNRLQRAGCIELRRRRILVRSVDALRERAGELPYATTPQTAAGAAAS